MRCCTEKQRKLQKEGEADFVGKFVSNGTAKNRAKQEQLSQNSQISRLRNQRSNRNREISTFI
jgi:hypothetical protein